MVVVQTMNLRKERALSYEEASYLFMAPRTGLQTENLVGGDFEAFGHTCKRTMAAVVSPR